MKRYPSPFLSRCPIRRECTWDPPLEVTQGNPQLAKKHAQETQEPAAPPGLAEPGASGVDGERDGKSKDREEEVDGVVPGIEGGGGGDNITGLEIVVIPTTDGGASSLDAGDNFDDSLGRGPPKDSKVRQANDSDPSKGQEERRATRAPKRSHPPLPPRERFSRLAQVRSYMKVVWSTERHASKGVTIARSCVFFFLK